MSLTLPSTDGSTSPARKQVLVFRELPPDQLARLTAMHDVTVADPRKPDERARFDAALAQAHGLIGSSFPIDAAVLDSAVFWGMGFAGTSGPWLTWALGDLAVKLAVAVGLLLPFRLLMGQRAAAQ